LTTPSLLSKGTRKFKDNFALLISQCGEKERKNSEQRRTLLLAGESSLALTKRRQAAALQKFGASNGRSWPTHDEEINRARQFQKLRQTQNHKHDKKPQDELAEWYYPRKGEINRGK
jgi:hypothetical protein